MTPLRWLGLCVAGMVGAAVAHTFGNTLAVGLFSVIVLIGALCAIRSWRGH